MIEYQATGSTCSAISESQTDQVTPPPGSLDGTHPWKPALQVHLVLQDQQGHHRAVAVARQRTFVIVHHLSPVAVLIKAEQGNKRNPGVEPLATFVDTLSVVVGSQKRITNTGEQYGCRPQ